MRDGIVMLLVLLVGTCTWAQDASSLEGKQAPEVSLNTIAGTTVKLSDQKGKVVLIDMWATWCPPCRKSLPDIQEFSTNKKLADQGLVVWAVNMQDEPQDVKTFLHESHYTFTVPMDVSGNVAKAYLVESIPTTVIVGRDVIIKSVFCGLGPDTARNVNKAVKEAIAAGH